jgi:hypothetical protein
MWLFTRYGFYSVACANKPDGSLDKETVMLRARREEHLQNLCGRFPAISDSEVVTMANRDYRYRLILPKQVWVPILGELAEEQDWSNFKNEAAAYLGKSGASYLRALHDVWEIMFRMQS